MSATPYTHMMTRTKTAWLISGLIILPWYSFGQVHGSEMPEPPLSQYPAPPPPHRWPVLPVRRWILSFNPWGLLEPQAAIGAGIGYRLRDNLEIWSETSFLTRGFPDGYDHTSGIRQILQLKYFFGKNRDFFVAGEVRYKSFTTDYRDNFYDQTTRDTLSFSHRSRYYFFGAGLQLGGRFRLGKSDHFFLELTGGLGVKQKTIIRYGVPSGYTYLPIRSIDINAAELMNRPGAALYLPGSMRLIYSFGRKLK
jgi:hypothetical protein